MLGRAVTYVKRRAGWRWLVWTGLLAVAGGVFQFVPLLDVLGYDFGFALGLTAAFAGVDIGHGVAVAARRSEEPTSLPRLVTRACAFGLAALALPLVLSLLNALRVRNCSVSAGLAFFFLLPVGTMLYAAPAGTLAGLLRRGGRVVAWLLPVASFVWSAVRLYRDPPVFALDPFGGYFPGPIYDEALRPDLRLLAFRGACLVWIGAAVAAVWTVQARAGGVRLLLRRAAVAGPLLLAGAALLAGEGRLGFHPDADTLRAVLGGERRSRHFVLRFDPHGTRTPQDLAIELDDLEFRWHQLHQRLGVEPAGPVTVYEFSSPEAKKELVGAGQTLFARPWSREIFVQDYHFPSPRLRHELAHVFAGRFGDRLFGLALAWRWRGPLPWPRLASGLVEGLAEAVDFDDPYGRATVHQDARAIIDQGRAPDLSAIVGAGFSLAAGPRAYTLAGSFCAFLLQRHGAASLRALYSSAGDFQAAYGKPLGELEAEWRTFLAGQKLDARDEAAARERYRRPAIFAKTCAREQAARSAEARAVLASDPERAAEILDAACRDNPGEPTLALDHAEAAAAAGRTGEALDGAARVLASVENTAPIRARAAGLLASIQSAAGDPAAALKAARRYAELATEEGDRRTALVEVFALESPGTRGMLARALLGDGPGKTLDPVVVFRLVDEFARRHPGAALGPYLVGRQLASRDPVLALSPLEAALAVGGPAPRSDGDLSGPLPSPFRRECLRGLADAAYRAGELGRADEAARGLVAAAETEAERLRATDFLERVRWASQRGSRAAAAE